MIEPNDWSGLVRSGPAGPVRIRTGPGPDRTLDSVGSWQT